MRCSMLHWEKWGKPRKPISVSRFENRICGQRNRIAAYMNTTVMMHRHTDKIKREDSYEARVVHIVHFGIYIYTYIYIYIYMPRTYGTYAFVSNYVLCIRIKPTSAYEVMWIYYIISIVNFRQVSTTFCVLLQGGTIVKYQCMVMKHVLCVSDIDQIYTVEAAVPSNVMVA